MQLQSRCIQQVPSSQPTVNSCARFSFYGVLSSWGFVIHRPCLLLYEIQTTIYNICIPKKSIGYHRCRRHSNTSITSLPSSIQFFLSKFGVFGFMRMVIKKDNDLLDDQWILTMVGIFIFKGKKWMQYEEYVLNFPVSNLINVCINSFISSTRLRYLKQSYL